eukprot:CAMPEP_0174828264 /NCGR_PEP_ID=MMETSP1114-20130205/1221_1 /TAXON_ID=312471 /ORGANISM="Neobodo designis, Strain CCAP 1951/1" /LENGTH=399 /DNA_ID=CAMNT_0016061977 /DNA_START=100 /DNA_END=1299 /DNA_ORIENTATION=+
MPRNYKKNRGSGRREGADEQQQQQQPNTTDAADATDAPPAAESSTPQKECSPLNDASSPSLASPGVPPTPPPTPAVPPQRKPPQGDEANDFSANGETGDGIRHASDDGSYVVLKAAEPTPAQTEAADAAAAELAVLEQHRQHDNEAAAAAHAQEDAARIDEAEAEAEGEAAPWEGGVVGPGSAEAAAEAQQHARDIVAAEEANAREHAAAARQQAAEREAEQLASHHHVSVEERQSQSAANEKKPDLSPLGVNSTLAAAADPAHSPTYVSGQRSRNFEDSVNTNNNNAATVTSVGASTSSSRAGGRHVSISPNAVVMGADAPSPKAPMERHSSEMVPMRGAADTAAPAAQRTWQRASGEEDRGDVQPPARLQAKAPEGRVWWCDAAIVLGAAAFIARCV